jgi:hypothetical protein
MLYFYLTALLIIALSFVYGKGFYLGFLFYLWMFFLFDFRDILVEIPFSWLFKFLGAEPSGTVTLVGGIGIALISLAMVIWGLFHMKYFSRTFWGRTLVLVFVLLPFFLRY